MKKDNRGALRWRDERWVWLPLCQCERPVPSTTGGCLTCGGAILAELEAPSPEPGRKR